jgi:hypothetical protein
MEMRTRLGQPPLEYISNADLRIPVVGAGDAGAPESDGRTNPCTEMLTQPLPHFKFQIHGRSTLLVPIDEQVGFEASPLLIVKPGSIERRAQPGVIHVISTRVSSHRRNVLEGWEDN